jgi:hypothetical protein
MADPYELSIPARWRWHRAMSADSDGSLRIQVKAMSDFGLSYYVAYLNAGIGHPETLRRAV